MTARRHDHTSEQAPMVWPWWWRLDWSRPLRAVPTGVHRLHARVTTDGPRVLAGWMLATPLGVLYLRVGPW